MTVTCYPSPGKRKALKICRAFAAGCGGTVAETGETTLRPGPAFFYGWTEHTAPLIARCRAEGRTWIYADNAYYFGRGTYFRVTRNALMHDGRGEAGPERFARFGIAVKPWRRDGEHIVVATQSEAFYRLHLGTTRELWTARVCDELDLFTRRPVVVCHKPPLPWPGDDPHGGFEEALPGAWAVVSHSSSVMVKALIEGVPVISLGPSMASIMGTNDPAHIEDPRMPDGREQWLWNLAANQWTRGEMREGVVRCQLPDVSQEHQQLSSDI